jgi:hypothetical protein
MRKTSIARIHNKGCVAMILKMDKNEITSVTSVTNRIIRPTMNMNKERIKLSSVA